MTYDNHSTSNIEDLLDPKKVIKPLDDKEDEEEVDDDDEE